MIYNQNTIQNFFEFQIILILLLYIHIRIASCSLAQFKLSSNSAIKLVFKCILSSVSNATQPCFTAIRACDQQRFSIRCLKTDGIWSPEKPQHPLRQQKSNSVQSDPQLHQTTSDSSTPTAHVLVHMCFRVLCVAQSCHHGNEVID